MSGYWSKEYIIKESSFYYVNFEIDLIFLTPRHL